MAQYFLHSSSSAGKWNVERKSIWFWFWPRSGFGAFSATHKWEMAANPFLQSAGNLKKIGFCPNEGVGGLTQSQLFKTTTIQNGGRPGWDKITIFSKNSI